MGDLDNLAQKYGFIPGESYHNVSMGQGQDVVAMGNLEKAHREGHWVVLNNVHLMPRWLVELEKKLDEFAQEGSNKKFRLFLSSDASNAIPIGLLNRCIKITNEPPAGLKANIKRAFASLNKETFEDYDSKMKSILFGLCHFHAVMLERKQYGPMGFNMMYPFSIGDLRDSAMVLSNYMENSGGGKIPWADLRYIFGEIMYGGHIVNDFDRKMCNTYLDFYMREELLEEMVLYPYADLTGGSSAGGASGGGSGGGHNHVEVFKAPPTSAAYDTVLEHIDEGMKTETPLAFGLHPNAEIGFRTQTSEDLLRMVLELSANSAASSSSDANKDGGDAGEGQSAQQVVEAMIQDILETFRDVKYDVEGMGGSVEDMGPFQNIVLQECERMNNLVQEMIRSLVELDSGFKGDLTISD
eukprot:gene13144-15167_t